MVCVSKEILLIPETDGHEEAEASVFCARKSPLSLIPLCWSAGVLTLKCLEWTQMQTLVEIRENARALAEKNLHFGFSNSYLVSQLNK
jgi:hypothetical protein